MIQKVEKWRIQELEQVLIRISLLMRKGSNSDWASVFSHCAQEAKHLAFMNLQIQAIDRRDFRELFNQIFDDDDVPVLSRTAYHIVLLS